VSRNTFGDRWSVGVPSRVTVLAVAICWYSALILWPELMLYILEITRRLALLMLRFSLNSLLEWTAWGATGLYSAWDRVTIESGCGVIFLPEVN